MEVKKPPLGRLEDIAIQEVKWSTDQRKAFLGYRAGRLAQSPEIIFCPARILGKDFVNGIKPQQNCRFCIELEVPGLSKDF